MNYVSLLGRFTRDPEVNYSQSGKAYVRFSLAVNREFKKDEADFINCVAWDKTAEIIGQYFNKGSRILVQGRLSVNSYEKDGEKRFSTDVVVSNINFIDSKTDVENKNENRNYKTNTEEVNFDEDDDFPF